MLWIFPRDRALFVCGLQPAFIISFTISLQTQNFTLGHVWCSLQHDERNKQKELAHCALKHLLLCERQYLRGKSDFWNMSRFSSKCPGFLVKISENVPNFFKSIGGILSQKCFQNTWETPDKIGKLGFILQRQTNCVKVHNSETSFPGQLLSNHGRSERSSTVTRYKPPLVTEKRMGAGVTQSV